jgi:hypothetical protein
MMKGAYTGLFLASLFLLNTLFSACKKEQTLTQGGELFFSTDTLRFDTVFTAQGSFTVGLKIYNRQGQKINISSVRMEKGDQSYFHLNVDGVPGNYVTNREIAAYDSIYVFATVNIDPSDRNTPFVVEDRMIATLNGRAYSLPFQAYGQNAYYVVDSVLQGTVRWRTDKPYVIINSAAVDANSTLILPPGCRVYMHANSRLLVLGRLLARGTKQDSIIFQGDRLDRSYFGYVGYPGEWGGIYFFQESHGNELDWVVLKNCGNSALGALPAAIQVTGPSTTGNLQLSMKHTIIENSIGYGIVSFQGKFEMENSLVYATGAPALAVFQGGEFSVRNCDFINYNPPRITHTDNPTVAVLNYLDTGNRPQDYISGELRGNFTNCLIYGSLEEEFVAGRKGNHVFDLKLDHCLLKTSRKQEVLPDYVTQVACKYNEDPRFVSHSEADYRPADNSSPLVNAGTGTVSATTDLAGKPRMVGAIDIGCYEFQ